MMQARMTATPTARAAAETMRAIALRRYGPPSALELTMSPVPEPAADQALVRVRAASVNPTDWHRMRGEPILVRSSAGWLRPGTTLLGADLAGVVEAVGAGVTELWQGDEVYGMSLGTFAEYVVVNATGLARKPAGLSFEEAAAVPVAAITALQGLRDVGNLRPGQSVLVNGASGGVGSFAVQLARALGAGKVTGVTSTGNVELVTSLGADRVIDYTGTDLLADTQRYDVILDVAGSRSVRSMRALLASGGILIVCGGPPGRWLGPMTRWIAASVLTRLGGPRAVPFLAHRDRDDLDLLRDLLEAGRIRPVIDRSYALAEVPDALAYVETLHARGKVVITI